MTSNSKTIAFLLAAVLILLGPAALAAPGSIMQRGDLTIAPGQTVLDVVVSDGGLTVSGQVEGSVFVVNGSANLLFGAVVKGDLTVLAGDLWMAAGSAVEGEVNVLSGRAHLEPGSQVRSEVKALEQVSSLTPERIALVSRYVIFAREVPPADFPLARLSELDLEALGLGKVHDLRPGRLDLFDLGEVHLRRDEVAEAREVLSRGRDVRVRVTLVRFHQPAGAEALWERLLQGYEGRVDYSVHNSMGEGAHWFFRHHGASYALWRQGPMLAAVMVRHDDGRPGATEWTRVEDLRDRTIQELIRLFHSAAGPSAQVKGQ